MMITLMQRNRERGRVTMMSITEMTVSRKAQSPGLSPTVAMKKNKMKLKLVFHLT